MISCLSSRAGSDKAHCVSDANSESFPPHPSPKKIPISSSLCAVQPLSVAPSKSLHCARRAESAERSVTGSK